MNFESKPVAWAHNDPDRIDVIHDDLKKLWIRVKPKHVENYTVPLFNKKLPMSTDSAIQILRSHDFDPFLDGNLLKLLRAIEMAHGINHD